VVTLDVIVKSTPASAAVDLNSIAPRCTDAKRIAAKVQDTASSERIAIVIANGGYAPSVGWLDNSVTDGIAFADRLSALGYPVLLLIDLPSTSLAACVSELYETLNETQISVLFYTGHGIQIADENFIIPIDAKENDTRGISIDGIVRFLREKSEATIVLLDACRTNPLAQRSGLSISTGEDYGLKAKTGTATTIGELFIAYATAPNSVASDGSDGFSPFSRALIDVVDRPGWSIQQMLAQVTFDVAKETGWLQTPFTRSTLTRLLPLARTLADADLVMRSKSMALDAEAALKKGLREDALSLALAALPSGATDEEITTDYAAASSALRRAYVSRPIRLNRDSGDAADFRVSNDVSRVLLLEGDRNYDPNVSRPATLWDTATGDMVRDIGQAYIFETYTDNHPVFADDAKLILLKDTPTSLSVLDWDGVTVDRIVYDIPHDIGAGQITSDGQYVVVPSYDGDVHIFDRVARQWRVVDIARFFLKSLKKNSVGLNGLILVSGLRACYVITSTDFGDGSNWTYQNYVGVIDLMSSTMEFSIPFDEKAGLIEDCSKDGNGILLNSGSPVLVQSTQKELKHLELPTKTENFEGRFDNSARRLSILQRDSRSVFDTSTAQLLFADDLGLSIGVSALYNPTGAAVSAFPLFSDA
jgi:uncharacterized caspase-like protein